MNKVFYSSMILATLAFNVWAMGELSFDKSLSIAQDGADKIFIDVGAGSLKVTGDDIDEIKVNAKIYSDEYSGLDELQDVFANKVIFSLKEKGSGIVLKALSRRGFFGNSRTNISMDLEVVIPKNMNVEIDDGSGSMSITNLDGMLEIDDGSGSIYISDIANKVTIDDSSGNLEIRNIGANIAIDDGSGKIFVSNVQGNVFVDDGSGEIDMINITGDVKIDDGSGSINVKELAGNFTLVDGGSGYVYVNGERWIED